MDDSSFDERTFGGKARVAKIVRNLQIMGEWRLFGLEISKGNKFLQTGRLEERGKWLFQGGKNVFQ